MASGVNKRRVIQKVSNSFRLSIISPMLQLILHFHITQTVFDELVELVTATNKPFKMTKGKSNVVMFVGLQVFTQHCASGRKGGMALRPQIHAK